MKRVVGSGAASGRRGRAARAGGQTARSAGSPDRCDAGNRLGVPLRRGFTSRDTSFSFSGQLSEGGGMTVLMPTRVRYASLTGYVGLAQSLGLDPERLM